MIIPDKAILRASKWCYSGVWSVVTQWMRVPEQPPQILGAHDQRVRSFRPAEGFLRYLKLFFWIGLFAFDGLLFVGWLIFTVAFPVIGLVFSPLVLAVMVLPDIVAYIAIHLRYDTTWYVLSDRSMRIRRGIWSIHETTITYDNIQNVSIRQGPVQRYFGIANVLVETAGGGASTGHGESASVVGHHGLLEGIDNAEEVRAQIIAKWKDSRSSGLGDESHSSTPSPVAAPPVAPASLTESQLQLLEEIHRLAQELVRQE